MIFDMPRPDYEDEEEKKENKIELTPENSDQLFNQLKGMFGNK